MLDGNIDNCYMQINISAAAAAIWAPFHISYGMIISMETSWISWLEMIYRENQWNFQFLHETAKTKRAGSRKAKTFLAFFSVF